ncbi:MAG: hypothetical protein CHACPFDD_03466 [Phycisphaerae bacterium]|nr:hypothetical protein [Phycisphaerae bacterium]
MAPDASSQDVAALLDAVGRGDSAALERLFPVVYDELHRLASGLMRGERPDHTLQPTELVHEAFLRLVRPGADGKGFENRRHFVATAAVAMRRILINHARARDALKRGGGQPAVALEDAAAIFESRAVDLVALDELLDELARLDPLQARLVELRFFGGMSFEECAAVLGVSARTIYYEWAHARAWLRGHLASE